MKTANEIIRQGRRIMLELDKTAPDYIDRLRTIAGIGRHYLHNIARHYGKPYGIKTWQEIGDHPLPASIYAK